jgi:hypothetical protein
MNRHTISLTHDQRNTVMLAANALPQQLRDAFLLKVEARLQLRAIPSAIISNNTLSHAVDSALFEFAGGIK